MTLQPLGQKKIWFDPDISIQPLLDKRVVILGYGNQGRPQALNLRDSGIQVKIGARANSTKRRQAEEEGFEVLSIPEALAWGEVIMCLLPDEVLAQTYHESLAPHLKAGQYLGFGHGLAIHAGWIQPAPQINVLLVAPKGQGRGVRNKFLLESGVPALVGVHQDPSGNSQEIALAYARAIGSGRVGVLATTFSEETECDLFTEQTVLCGGLTSLIKTAFETLVEAGYSPETAYFECLYEVKLIADLLHERGITGMREAISSTALYGDLSRGEQVIDSHVKENMRRVLADITSGRFAEHMQEEFNRGKPLIRNRLEQDRHHLVERTHRYLHDRLRF